MLCAIRTFCNSRDQGSFQLQEIPGVYKPGDKRCHCTDGNLVHASVWEIAGGNSTCACSNPIRSLPPKFRRNFVLYSPDPHSACTEGLGTRLNRRRPFLRAVRLLTLRHQLHCITWNNFFPYQECNLLVEMCILSIYFGCILD